MYHSSFYYCPCKNFHFCYYPVRCYFSPLIIWCYITFFEYPLKCRAKKNHIKSQDLFCAHFRSSALGLQPVNFSIMISKIYQNRSFSNGQFNQPVVMQKYVSCGATWCTRWCFLGKIILCSCSQTTQGGSPKYVCDHLWICKISFICPNFVTFFTRN